MREHVGVRSIEEADVPIQSSSAHETPHLHDERHGRAAGLAFCASARESEPLRHNDVAPDLGDREVDARLVAREIAGEAKHRRRRLRPRRHRAGGCLQVFSRGGGRGERGPVPEEGGGLNFGGGLIIV